MIFLFLVGSLVYKLSLINSAYFLSIQLSIHFYNTETQEPGLWGSGNSGSLILQDDRISQGSNTSDWLKTPELCLARFVLPQELGASQCEEGPLPSWTVRRAGDGHEGGKVGTCR